MNPNTTIKSAMLEFIQTESAVSVDHLIGSWGLGYPSARLVDIILQLQQEGLIHLNQSRSGSTNVYSIKRPGDSNPKNTNHPIESDGTSSAGAPQLRIFNNPNHPQYGPVRRMSIILTQLNMLDFLESQYSTNSRRGITWDIELAGHIAAHAQTESATFTFYLWAWLIDYQRSPEWTKMLSEIPD